MAQAHDPSQPPPGSWDDDLAEALVGRIVLVGMTYLTKDEQLVRQEQFYGVVVSADRRLGIRLELEGQRAGEEHVLPPHTANFQKARPGDYNLRSTGETVADPDYLSSWTIYPRDDAKPARPAASPHR